MENFFHQDVPDFCIFPTFLTRKKSVTVILVKLKKMQLQMLRLIVEEVGIVQGVPFHTEAFHRPIKA